MAVSALTLLLPSLQTPSGGDPSLGLALAGALIAPPPGLSLASLRTVDLPVTGRVAVSPGDVQSGRIGKLPYVGEVGLIGDLDGSNVALLETDGGLFVRGNVRAWGLGFHGFGWKAAQAAAVGRRRRLSDALAAAHSNAEAHSPLFCSPNHLTRRPPQTSTQPQSKPHPSCTPLDNANSDPQWKPFVLTVRLPAGALANATLAGASASAAGAYAWCVEPAAVAAVAAVERSNFETRGFRGLHGAGAGRLLMVSPQSTSAFGIFPEYVTNGEGVAADELGDGTYRTSANVPMQN